MLFTDYSSIPSNLKDFVLEHTLSSSFVVKEVVRYANCALSFLLDKDPENVPYWVYERTYSSIFSCYSFLICVKNHSCSIPSMEEDVFKKLVFDIEEIDKRYKLVEKKFFGWYSEEEIRDV